MRAQRILLLSNSDNGLTQRVRLTLARHGHLVTTRAVTCTADIESAVAAADVDLIICPWLTVRIPESVHSKHKTVIVHPGVPHDRGPSSLDWAISERLPRWGVTAIGAEEDMDAGPVWAYRVFDLPRLRKSAVYNLAVADHAVEVCVEVADKARDPEFTPTPQHLMPYPVAGATTRPLMTQRDRGFSWDAPADRIIDVIDAGDGAPGTLADLAGHQFYLYDAHLGAESAPPNSSPGQIVGGRHHRVEVATGRGTVWIGHLRRPAQQDRAVAGVKAPAATMLSRAGALTHWRHEAGGGSFPGEHTPVLGKPEISYTRPHPQVGVIEIDIYNGAMTTGVCLRLTRALRYAAAQDTRVLILQGNPSNPYFSNGIALGAIEAAPDGEAAAEAWANLSAINSVARTLITTRNQLTVAVITGNAGAGGAMLAAATDVVAVTQRSVLNPHYATMGLPGSELHTYSLHRRVGAAVARKLLTDCSPIDARHALDIGFADEVLDDGDGHQILELALRHSDTAVWSRMLAHKSQRLDDDGTQKPLVAYEVNEMGQMGLAIFGDRAGFAAKRRAFLTKTPAAPAHRPAVALAS